MEKLYTLLLTLCIVAASTNSFGQEIRIFTSKDFDLIGKVKSCMVSTNYGKEEYDFNEDGLLVKSVTRYNDQDYDTTYYKFENGELIEKRSENYRDNVFDRGISIANIYEIDTTNNRRVIEKIVSYDKEYLDQYEYTYDAKGLLNKIVRTNKEGTDETEIAYASLKGEDTRTAKLNGVLLESVRTSSRKTKEGSIQKIVLTKKYLDGEPNSAVEVKYDKNGKMVSRTNFRFSPESKRFAPVETTLFTYDGKGILTKTETKRGETTEVKEYIYQFDHGENGNWIKQIIMPGNAYTTRKIAYYEPLEFSSKD